MRSEIELKLELSPADWHKLVRRRAWLQSQHQCQHLSSVYFDTTDCRLRDAGYALRVRSGGGRSVQTLKSLGTTAGLFDRPEWETEIDGTEPDLSQLRNLPLAGLAINRLRPVFRAEIVRHTYQIVRPDANLEIDIDEGTLCGEACERPVSELEIELIEGDPAAVFDLARRVSEIVPVRLGVMSKAERGYALASPMGPAVKKSDAAQLHRGMSVADGLAVIVASCLRHFRLNEPFLKDEKDVEALHQARVAIRRLLSALALFRPVADDNQLVRIRNGLRWFMAETGDARNLDVYLQHELSSDQRQFVEERRRDAYHRAIRAMDSARFRRLMLDVLAWSLVGQWRHNSGAGKSLDRFVQLRMRSSWSKVANTDAVSSIGDGKRHRLRIRAKKLRYTLEFLDGLHQRRPRQKRAFRRRLEQLQESLGSLHDIATARSLVALNPWLSTPEPTGKRKRRLVRQAERAIRRLCRIGPYW